MLHHQMLVLMYSYLLYPPYVPSCLSYLSVFPPSSDKNELANLPLDKHEKALVSNVISPQDIGVTYSMIGGLDEVKEQLRQCITYPLKYPRLYQEGDDCGGDDDLDDCGDDDLDDCADDDNSDLDDCDDDDYVDNMMLMMISPAVFHSSFHPSILPGVAAEAVKGVLLFGPPGTGTLTRVVVCPVSTARERLIL